jgi:hypothetical protein
MQVFKNSQKQGDYGVGWAIQYFTALSYGIMMPLGSSQDYDLVIDNGTTLQKVQVKTTSQKHLNLQTTGGSGKHHCVYKKHDKMEYDLLFVVDGDDNKYLIPYEVIKNNVRSITLNKYKEYKLGC